MFLSYIVAIEDFTSSIIELVFPADSAAGTMVNFSFDIVDDEILEDTETIPLRAVITDGDGTFTDGSSAESRIDILDNDGKNPCDQQPHHLALAFKVSVLFCSGASDLCTQRGLSAGE